MDGEDAAIWDRHYSRQAMGWRGEASIDIPLAPGSKVLETGCGNGKAVAALLRQGHDVHAVDFSPVAVESCRRRYGTSAAFHVADVRSLPFEDQSFDAVLAVHVLSHLRFGQRELAATEMARCLRPGGLLLMRYHGRDDLRYGGEELEAHSFLRGNGIFYHHFDEPEALALFPGMDWEHSRTWRRRKRYSGETVLRSTTDILLRSPGGED